MLMKISGTNIRGMDSARFWQQSPSDGFRDLRGEYFGSDISGPHLSFNLILFDTRTLW